MRLRRRFKHKKLLIISLAVIIVLGGGYAAAAASQGWWPFTAEVKDVNYDQPTDEQRAAGQRKSDQTKQTAEPADPPSKEPSDPPSDPSQAEITITSTAKNSGQLQIRTLIHSIQTGQCTLTLTSGEHTVTRSADTQPLASASTCKGFDIPLSQLPSGEWTLTIDYKDADTTGTTSKTITI